MKITKEWLKEKSACMGGFKWFTEQDESDSVKVLEKLKLEQEWSWFNWLASRLMTHPQRVEWSIFCAEQVIDIFEKKFPKDDRPRKAIEAAKDWLKNPTEKNRKAAAAYASAYTAAHAAATSAAAYAADAADAAATYAAYTAHVDDAADSDNDGDAAATYASAAAYAADAADANANAAARLKMRKICSQKAMEILSRKEIEVVK